MMRHAVLPKTLNNSSPSRGGQSSRLPDQNSWPVESQSTGRKLLEQQQIRQNVAALGVSDNQQNRVAGSHPGALASTMGSGTGELPGPTFLKHDQVTWPRTHTTGPGSTATIGAAAKLLAEFHAEKFNHERRLAAVSFTSSARALLTPTVCMFSSNSSGLFCRFSALMLCLCVFRLRPLPRSH